MNMNLIQALVGLLLLTVTCIVFAQCCPGDGTCPNPTPATATATASETLERTIATTEASTAAVGTQFAELNTLGEQVMAQEGLDAEKLAPLQAKYVKTLSLLRYSSSIVGLAKFESEFIQDDTEYAEATRLVLKAQKALTRAQTLINEMRAELTALSPQADEVVNPPDPPVEDNDG